MNSGVLPSRAAIGRATLLRALQVAKQARSQDAAHDCSLSEAWAELLGFGLEAPAPVSGRDEAISPGTVNDLPETSIKTDSVGGSAHLPLGTTFFAVTRYDQRIETDGTDEDNVVLDASTSDVQPLTLEDCRPRSLQAPAHVPLVPMTRLWPAVRRSIAVTWDGGLDLRRLVHELAAARPPRPLPRRRLCGVSGELQVFWDRADHLAPYDRDYQNLLDQLHRHVGDHGLRLWQVDALPTQALGELVPVRSSGQGGRSSTWAPAPMATESGRACRRENRIGHPLPWGSTVLLLGDAGSLSGDDKATAIWSAWMRQLASQQCRVVVWAPCGEVWFDPVHTRLATVHGLVPGSSLRAPTRRLPDRTAAACKALADRRIACRDHLLVRASVCVHLGPQLLRSLRVGDLVLAREPAAEALVWGAGERVQRSRVSRAVAPAFAAHYRSAMAALDVATQRGILQCTSAAHASLGRSTETAEVLIWQAHAHEDAARAEQPAIQEAQHWAHAWGLRMERDAQRGHLDRQARQFAADLLARIGPDQRFVTRHEGWTSRLWALSGSTTLPKGLSVRMAMEATTILTGARDRPPQTFWLSTHQDELHLTTRQMAVPRDRLHRIGPVVAHQCVVSGEDGGPRRVIDPGGVATLARAGRPGQRLTLTLDDVNLQVTELTCPPWASEWGHDEYGLFAVIEVKDVRQRLRYIPPGRFHMGSPEGVGHDGERPQHDVLLTEGYWLADTPCTQALWTAVMGENPSEFQKQANAGNHPIENVRWDDVEHFLKRLATLLPAGCQPTFPTEAQWEYAARAGTETAYWWGDEPDDQRANWNEQHKGTTPVDRYPLNPWGLHDMHGNVWEWCLDDRRAYESIPVRDPVGDPGSSVSAVRGGSWIGHPGGARSASRFGGHRDGRRQNLGFRLALRFPSPVPGVGGPGQGDELGRSSAGGTLLDRLTEGFSRAFGGLFDFGKRKKT